MPVQNATSNRGALLLAQALSQPFAILPSAREQMLEIVERHGRGEAADIAAIEAKLGRPLANEPQGYEVVNGIAIVSIAGPIFAKANLLQAVSGGTSAQLLERDLRSAGADPNVRGIVLSVDSPGGSTLGTPEAGSAIRAVSAQKPTVAHSDGLMASAAYWLGSAANAIFLSGPTVTVGSIGVAATHSDRSIADRQAGVTRTEIYAGTYKRIASDTKPLSADGAATIQAQVDYLYSLFVEAVAANRGTNIDTVLSEMADGRIFIGQQAIDAGLADGFSSLDDLVRAMSADPSNFVRRRTTQRGGQASAKPAASNASSSAGGSMVPVARYFTEAEAAAYAERNGVRLSTARTALGVKPAAGAGQRTRSEIAEAASAYAAQHGVSFLTALHAVATEDDISSASNAQPPVPVQAKSEKQLLVERARAFATKHSTDFETAVKALGGDPATSAADVRTLRYMAEHRCSRLDAVKALVQ